MIIQNGLVFEESGSFVKRDLYIGADHKIAAAASADEHERIDAEGLYVLPGLVDVHIHGAVGSDFCDGSKEGLCSIAAYLKANGITSFCPTSMTLPLEELKQIFSSILQVPAERNYASVAGIHMEGPFIAPAKKGAQKASHIIAPNVDAFHALQASCDNRIRLITLAPEEEGSMEFIRAVHEEVSISLGHSQADYETASQAYAAGANHVTHLYNAMMPLHHRDPGIIGAAADAPHVFAEIICDGIHIHPSAIRAAFRLFGAERMVLISDAMRATGMEDGCYDLGGQEVIKNGNRATLADGTLAGSVTNLFSCMKNAVSFGIPLYDAVRAATLNPARSIGAHTIGSLAVGKEADVLLVDKELNLVRVL